MLIEKIKQIQFIIITSTYIMTSCDILHQNTPKFIIVEKERKGSKSMLLINRLVGN